MNQFKIKCNKCGCEEYKIEHKDKFHMFYDDSYTEHWVFLKCINPKCDNKVIMYSYTTS